MHTESATRRSVSRLMAGALFAGLTYLGAAPALAQADLKIEKTGTLAQGRAGARIATFTITLTNSGTADVVQPQVVDDPLPGAAAIDWTIGSLTGAVTCNIYGTFPATQMLACDADNIRPGNFIKIVVTGVVPDTCLKLDNTATASYHDYDDGTRHTVSSSASITITSDTCRPAVFVIGDNEPHDVGNFVNFWGAQWWQNNFMTGAVSDGVASFKGYASNADIGCSPGSRWVWDTRPGNSSNPPATIPTDVMVIVTDTVQKDGPNIKGSIKQILLVRSDGTYASNPGHRGDGQVVGVVCTAP